MGSGLVSGTKCVLQLFYSVAITLGLLCLLALAASNKSSHVGPAMTERAPGPPLDPSEIRLGQAKDISSSSGGGGGGSSSSSSSSIAKFDTLHKSSTSSHTSSPADLPKQVPPFVELDHSGMASIVSRVSAAPKVRPSVVNGVDEICYTHLELMQDNHTINIFAEHHHAKQNTETNAPELSILDKKHRSSLMSCPITDRLEEQRRRLLCRWDTSQCTQSPVVWSHRERQCWERPCWRAPGRLGAVTPSSRTRR